MKQLFFLTDGIPQNITIIKSRYGIFRIHNPYLTVEKSKEIRNIYYVNDNSSANYLRKIVKSDEKAIIVFEPESHYYNMMQIYNGFKILMEKAFYGTTKKPLNPFRGCKTPTEIFNLSRRIKLNEKSLLTKVFVMSDYDGNLRLKGENRQLSTIKNLFKIQQEEVAPTKGLGFYKHDYLLPISFWQGANSSEEYEKKGITISLLNNKRIYPKYGVWSPTSQHYLKLLDNYIEEKRAAIKK